MIQHTKYTPHLLLLLLGLIIVPQTSLAQLNARNTSANTSTFTNPADTITEIYLRFNEIQRKYDLLADSLSRVQQGFERIDKRVIVLNDDLSSSLNTLNRLTEDDVLSKETRLKVKKERVLATARFLRSALNSFDAVDAALAQSEYLNDVSQLNSPTNEDLGFSLHEEIIEVLESQIIKSNSRFNEKDPDKFKTFVKTIIENPVVTAISTSVPALVSISSVVNLVSSICVRERGVSAADFQKFREGLKKYITHYEALAQASYDFNSNVDKLKVKTEALREVLRSFTVERINTLSPESVRLQDTILLSMLLTTHYRPDYLDVRIGNIINEHRNAQYRLNYQSALNDSRLDYPLYAINQALFIQQELEQITNEYISTYQIYHSRLMDILSRSKELSRDPEKVNIKRQNLDTKLDRLVSTFKKNVKIREVNIYLQEIPAY